MHVIKTLKQTSLNNSCTLDKSPPRIMFSSNESVADINSDNIFRNCAAPASTVLKEQIASASLNNYVAEIKIGVKAGRNSENSEIKYWAITKYGYVILKCSLMPTAG